MELQTIKASLRPARKKSDIRRQRAQGLIPTVLYGLGREPVSLAVPYPDFLKVTHSAGGEHAVVQIEVEGGADMGGPAMIKAVQHHPFKDFILHADFQRINLDEEIHTYVSINLVGKPKGLQDGGVLDTQLREVEVACLALDVPDQLDIDISGLEVGESLHVGDLAAPPTVRVITEADRTIATVLAPRVVTDEEEAAEGEEEAAEEEGEEEGEG